MFTNFGTAEAARSLTVIKQLRAAGISCELYPDTAKLKKQMAYANGAGIPFVAIIGDKELASGMVTLKNMAEGSQAELTVDALVEALK